MRTIPTLFLVLAGLLAACAPVGTRELHEVVLASADGATKLRYVYGSADTMVLNGRVRGIGDTVGDAAQDVSYAVAGARRVDGDPYLATAVDRPLEPPMTVARIPLTSDLRVRTSAPVARALYFDGSRWHSLGRDLTAGRTLNVAPGPTSGRLRGVGSLTPAEADAIANAIAASGRPALVALLPEGTFADRAETQALAARPADGLDEYRHTALWIQRGLPVDAAAYAPPADDSIVEVVASGDQGEAPGEDTFVLLDDPEALLRFWNAVHAASFAPPPVPDARFERETLLGVRLAERPSGGYGVEIENVTVEDGEAYVDVRTTEPAEGELSTTVVTTPWVLVRVLGVEASVAWFRDAESGELIAVARGEDRGSVF